ncbi:MAG: hypothetical protein HC868_12965 [Sphingomonadales bacterium]|nr:hypothetical protein [Sphingomonadales bacterium]
MTLEDNKQIVRSFIEKVLNKGDVDASGDYVAEDVVELVPFPGQGIAADPATGGLVGIDRGAAGGGVRGGVRAAVEP